MSLLIPLTDIDSLTDCLSDPWKTLDHLAPNKIWLAKRHETASGVILN